MQICGQVKVVEAELAMLKKKEVRETNKKIKYVKEEALAKLKEVGECSTQLHEEKENLLKSEAKLKVEFAELGT